MQSTWEAHKSSAEKAESLGRLAQAEAHWYAALEDAQAAFSMTDPRTTSTLECLSENLFRQSKYNLAVPVVAKSLEIFQISLGPSHPDVGILLNNLGMLHHLQNDYVEAEKFYQRSMTVLSKALGPTHPEMANLLANYSDLLVRTNRAAEAHQLRQMLNGISSGRWTRSVVHESYRPPEEDPEDCVRELGLEYQHRASELRLKLVQERIKDAAQKQQEPAPARPTKPEQKGLMSKLKDPSANPQKVSGSGKRSIFLAKPDEQVKGQHSIAEAKGQHAIAEAKDANESPPQLPQENPEEKQLAAYEQAQIATSAQETQATQAIKPTQLPLDEQLHQLNTSDNAKEPQSKYLTEPAPQTNSPFDQLAAALPQPVVPQFEHLSLTDPTEEKFPPGIVRILASRMNRRDMT